MYLFCARQVVAGEEIDFDIPAQAAGTALILLGQQSNEPVLYFYDDVQGKTSRAVDGTYTADAAIDLMLTGTGLVAQRNGRGVLTVALSQDASMQTGEREVKTPVQRRGFLASLAMLFGAQSEALAQAPEARPAVLEEVVVTARRRAEDLQDVPVAVTALSADALERRQIQTTTDLDRVTPSMQFTSYGQLSGNNSAAVVFIRGVGQLDPTPAVDPGVGIYIDDVYMGRAVGGAMDFFDVDNIQVLRGPQGTLFGRNTIGGAVLINSVMPGDEFEATLRARIGEDDLREVFGAVTVPLSDRVSARLSGGARRRDGYVTRVVDGQDLGDDDVIALNASLRWDASDSLEVILRADYSKEDENGSPFVFKGINTTAPVPAIVSVAAGCPGATIPFAPLAPGDPAFGAPFVPDTADLRCANNAWEMGPYTNGGNAPVESTFDVTGTSATVNWDISDRLTLHSISAYRNTDWTGIRDADNTPLTLITTDYTSESTQLSQEVRLDYGGDRMNGVVGVYYFDEDTDDRVTVPLAFPPAPPVIGSLLAGGPGTRDLQFVNLTTKSIAAFTEWTYDVTDALSLTGGVRYTEDDKSLQGTIWNIFPETDPDPSPLPTEAIPDGGPLFVYPDRFSESFDKVTGSASLRYSFDNGWMIYGSYATSFKSGGYNQRYNAPPAGFVPVPFSEETVDTLEFGFKADITDTFRLNGALFSSDYDDIQLIYRQGVVPLLFNAGKATIDGIELEFQLVPNDRLIFEGALSYLDDEIKDITDVPGATATITPDNSLPFTPELQANLGLGYRFPLNNGWSMTPRIDASYTDQQYFDAGNTEITAQQESVTVTNLSLVLESGSRWRATLHVENLTDELYPVQGNASLATLGYAEIIYARGRNVQASVSYEF
ncbi:MAG: TonB-dependent receptor [Gammaproteobacteria bacterium]|nr:TonB-dependent receptor [Gammaproteobacteria bacterium]